ncbi:hypothetical protein H5410_042535 [Solanum commersonii]|uniref:Uncharacterized protein n=1 Tax=Solanum commersonii TaxID=4109 RepID=A0A9J5XVZ6_SOLCO|nr:hypothetical protein H5410_042535 [Solanum commersonii]
MEPCTHRIKGITSPNLMVLHVYHLFRHRSGGENNGRGERDQWERRGKEFDGKGAIFGKKNVWGRRKVWAVYYFLEKKKAIWDLIGAVRSFDRMVVKDELIEAVRLDCKAEIKSKEAQSMCSPTWHTRIDRFNKTWIAKFAQIKFI